MSKSNLDERRDNADVICIQILVYLLATKNYEQFIKQFQMHFHTFKNNFEQIQTASNQANSFTLKQAHQRIEECKWRSNWHMLIAKMLE